VPGTNRKIDDDNPPIIEMKRIVAFSFGSPIFFIKKILSYSYIYYLVNCVEMLLRYRQGTIFHRCGFVKRLFFVTADGVAGLWNAACGDAPLAARLGSRVSRLK
jgi:hypothetical protein